MVWFGMVWYVIVWFGTWVQYELLLIIGLAVTGLVWLGGVASCQMNPRPGHYGKSMIV